MNSNRILAPTRRLCLGLRCVCFLVCLLAALLDKLLINFYAYRVGLETRLDFYVSLCLIWILNPGFFTLRNIANWALFNRCVLVLTRNHVMPPLTYVKYRVATTVSLGRGLHSLSAFYSFNISLTLYLFPRIIAYISLFLYDIIWQLKEWSLMLASGCFFYIWYSLHVRPLIPIIPNL